MKNCRINVLCFLLKLLVPLSLGQLSPTETTILLQLQQMIEFPQGWTNWTNFCWLPPSPSFNIVCSNGHVTELTLVGNIISPSKIPKQILRSKNHTLSKNFSIDALFTLLTKLSGLKILSLVSLGLWGPFPANISRLRSLEVLNVSSNFIYGLVPRQVVSLKNLSSLVLSDNLLNGSVPDLKSLVILQELNLADNNLGPNFPSLGKNLHTIILSNNSLRSVIPSAFNSFNRLRKLDISNNKLIGSIPSFLFSLPSIRYLDLAKNQLSGALPTNASCTSNLKFVDISSNLLVGKLPSCITSSSRNRTVISSWNSLSSGNPSSQHPFSFCHKEALAVKPPVKQNPSVQLGLILGISGGVIGITGVLVLLILITIRRFKSRSNNDKFEAPMFDKMSVISSSVPTIDSRRVPQTMRSAVIGLPPYRMFTLEEIEDATNNFDPLNFMGERSQGQLYKGCLGDGAVVLVKCVKLKQKNLVQSLAQHMEVFSKLRHLHLASVLGHCTVTYQDHPSTATTVFVLLQHITDGSLRDYLTDRRKKDILKWPQRMSIAIGVARGIQFLHTGVAPGIFGNNVNIENVYLDDTLTAKLTNYTIPMPSKVGSESPLNGQDIYNNSVNAEKEDIYQLGVILIQLITGKLVASSDELEELKIQLEKGLCEAPTKLRAMVDPSTRGSFAYESVRSLVKISMNCVCEELNNRPSIEDVLWNLQYSMQVQDGWTSSGNLANTESLATQI
ncbi:probable LRR receptor-like serine/threonine-protein kinase At1g14390 [Mercurialis annua]|uniref:probable LRR receptor-like serine/threonine-protein kinase At1g14390 n=1 Tax=Mercurialis annua TaxID=3986 RepID=UPI0021601E68|nr:probable LRR receptor-like serine/threonine-protein kinase At1g14390 [Mercurialis annua]